MTTLQDIMGLITKRKIKTPSDSDYIISAAYTDTQEVLKPQPKMEASLINIGELKKYVQTYVAPTAKSFDPLFTDASGTLAGVTATGSYTMISPKICFFRVYVDFSRCTNFGTLGYQITLPFPSAQTMRQANGTLHQPTGAAQYHIAGITDVADSSTTHKLYYSGSTTDLAWKYNTPVAGTSITSHFDISGTYEIV
jgi:hypothetical protein